MLSEDMKTIRRKISIGFIALSVVLFSAIAINIFEIARLSENTEEIIAEGAENTNYATRMFDALQKQNRAVLDMVLTNNVASSSEYHEGVVELNSAILEAMESSPENTTLKLIFDANANYHSIVEQHTASHSNEDESDWFVGSYVEAYYALDSAIKSYMTSPKSSVAIRMSRLESNIYKTITPSVLTLLVAVLILLLFYFFIDFYYTKPLRRISRSLDNYIKNRVPYQVKIEEKSELSSLSDNITEIIGQIKKQ